MTFNLSDWKREIARLLGPSEDLPSDRFALMAMPLAGGGLLGFYDTRKEAEDAQMEQFDPDNLWVRRIPA